MNDLNNIIDHAYSLVEQGHLKEAHQLFEQVCEQDNNNSEAWMMRGAIQLELGDTELAAEFLNRAITLDPDDIEAHFSLCKLFMSSNQLDKAIDSGRKAVSLDPDYGIAWLLLSGIYLDYGQTQEAEECGSKAIALLPGMQEAQINLVNILRTQGRLDEAIPLCDEIRNTQPTQADVWNGLGLAYQDKRQLTESESCFTKAVELNPQFAKAYCSLGEVQSAQGNFQQASLQLKKAITLNPDLPRTYFEYAKILLKNGTEEHQTLLQELQQDHLYKNMNEAREIAIKLANDFPYDDAPSCLYLHQFFTEFDPTKLYTKEWWETAMNKFGSKQLAHDKIAQSVFSAVYGWSLPCQEALDEIARFTGNTRVSSYGSGAGYWEYLLQTHHGLDIVAYDIKLRHRFIETREQRHSETIITTSDSIFLAWIPGILDGDVNMEPLLDQMVVGQKLVLIGEPAEDSGQPRTCGTRDFFQYLSAHFEHNATIPLATYSYMEDCVELFTKKS